MIAQDHATAFQPRLRKGRIGHRFLRREGLAHHHDKGGFGVQRVQNRFNVGTVDVAYEMARRSVRKAAQRPHRHGRTEVRPPDANVDHVRDFTALEAGVNLVHEGKHAPSNLKHLAHNVLAVHRVGIFRFAPQCHVHDRTSFGAVHVGSAKQLRNGAIDVRLFGQCQQPFHNLVVPPLLGHVHQQPVQRHRQRRRPARIGGKRFANIQRGLAFPEGHQRPVTGRFVQLKRPPGRHPFRRITCHGC